MYSKLKDNEPTNSKTTTKDCNINGIQRIKSFSELYKGGTLNAFGHPQNSMTTLRIQLTVDNKVCGVEINDKYFTTTPQIIAFNKLVTFDNPVGIIEAIQIAQAVTKFKIDKK